MVFKLRLEICVQRMYSGTLCMQILCVIQHFLINVQDFLLSHSLKRMTIIILIIGGVKRFEAYNLKKKRCM